jgi:DNA-binding NarL/FixJ family response regulator
MLSAYVRDRYLDAAIASGAWGYLSKSDSPDAVLDAVRKAAAGEFAFGPTVLERCKVEGAGAGRGGAGGPKPSSRLDLLTPREIQVLRLIGKGMSRLEIAKTLSRSPKTIDNHRAAIMEKLGIHDRVELARYAIEEGLAEV